MMGKITDIFMYVYTNSHGLKLQKNLKFLLIFFE